MNEKFINMAWSRGATTSFTTGRSHLYLWGAFTGHRVSEQRATKPTTQSRLFNSREALNSTLTIEHFSTSNMEAYNSHKAMDLGTTAASLSNRLKSLPSEVDQRMLELATPSRTTNDMEGQEIDNPGILMLDSIAPAVSQSELSTLTTHNNSVVLGSNLPQETTATDMQAVNVVIDDSHKILMAAEEGDWRSLTEFDVPDFMQTNITNLPQLHGLYNAYITSYTDPASTNATRMKIRQGFGFYPS